MSRPFRVGLTRDFLGPDGQVAFGDIGLDLLDRAPDVEWQFLDEDTHEIRSDQVRDYDALIVWAPSITESTLSEPCRLAIVARCGVGYDKVDVEACTRHGVLLTITPDGVRRPMAVSALAFILALAHRLLVKDRLTREGRWADASKYTGTGLMGRTLGLVGFGNIGREICTLAAPFGLRSLAFDPYVDGRSAGAGGAEKVATIEDLLEAADFVVVTCPYNSETHHLLNAARLARMRPTAFLINVARGPIVDQPALTEALRERRIAGAALDVYEREPIDPSDPLLGLDNVIATPHAIGWTDELFHGNGVSAMTSVLEVAAGRVPPHVVNRDVIESPLLRAKLRLYGGGGEP